LKEESQRYAKDCGKSGKEWVSSEKPPGMFRRLF
jgi:hypothetical protein